MRPEIHLEAFEERKETMLKWGIEIRGIENSQRIVGDNASKAITELLSAYLHKAKKVEEGFQVNHTWFKSDKVSERFPEFNNKETARLVKWPTADVVIRKRPKEGKKIATNKKGFLFFSNVIEHIKVIKEVAQKFFRYFRKRVCFSNENMISIAIMSISKSSSLRYNNREYELTKDRGLVSNVVGVPVLIAAGPMIILLAFFCLPWPD